MVKGETTAAKGPVTHKVTAKDTLSGLAGKYDLEDWRIIYHHRKNGDFREQNLDAEMKLPEGLRVWIPTGDTGLWHDVAQGETLGAITEANDLPDWKPIYGDPRNGALRFKNVDPHEPLRPGIDVFIPANRGVFHTVKEGEAMRHIANMYGFRSSKSIYNHEKNVRFRKENPEKHVLKPGAKVWVPEFSLEKMSFEAGKENRFVLKRLKDRLHLELTDENGEILGDKKYEILIRRKGEWVVYGKKKERRTTAGGVINKSIPVVKELKLRIWQDGDDQPPKENTLLIGAMDPIDAISGVQDRLTNLGYPCGQNDRGKMGTNTEKALRDFQNDNGLKTTGKINKETRAALLERFGA